MKQQKRYWLNWTSAVANLPALTAIYAHNWNVDADSPCSFHLPFFPQNNINNTAKLNKSLRFFFQFNVAAQWEHQSKHSCLLNIERMMLNWPSSEFELQMLIKIRYRSNFGGEWFHYAVHSIQVAISFKIARHHGVSCPCPHCWLHLNPLSMPHLTW